MALIRLIFQPHWGQECLGWLDPDGEGKDPSKASVCLVSNTEMFNLNHDSAPLPLIYMNKKLSQVNFFEIIIHE